MHDYMRAIGFSHLQNRKELHHLLDMVITNPGQDFAATSQAGLAYGEKSLDFAQRTGITVRGDLDEKGRFVYEYYYPHYMGRETSLVENLTIEKLAEREEYDGVCNVDDLGVTLIFHMNRLKDYAAYQQIQKKISHAQIILSALSISGTIILPVAKNKNLDQRWKKQNENRKKMIAAARNGDQEAIDCLAIGEMDMYTSIAKRMAREDVYTIVESSFMPYGISCDHYAILGEIMSCDTVYNQMSGEKLYQMLVICNDMIIDLCINAEDLTGEPAEGRRFKGNIWLQACLD